MFISYCYYSFIGQKAKMYIIGLKLKCQKAVFFSGDSRGEAILCFSLLLGAHIPWLVVPFHLQNQQWWVSLPHVAWPDLFSLPPPLLRTLVTIKLNGALWDSQA